MPKKQDYSQDALSAIERLIGEPLVEKKTTTPPKNPAAVALGRLGGNKGGPARAASLTHEQRKAIAQKAAKARWSKKDTVKKSVSKAVSAKELEAALNLKPGAIASAMKNLKKKAGKSA
jgi:hypothetical protein